jgi:regulator of cell morphogenesis and NO signaling
MIATDDSLGAIAAANPAATRVFLRHRIDFCCRGHRSLADACEEAGLAPTQLVGEIERESTSADDPVSWETAPLSLLVDHIETHYHAPLRCDVPALIDAARRVERVHASKPDVPTGLAEHLAAFWAGLQAHMQKEEQVLFPMIRRGAPGLDAPVRMLQQEHVEHGHDLQRIRELTGDLEIPQLACTTWTALYHGLAKLEEDLMQHIHLENNVLFVRAGRAG